MAYGNIPCFVQSRDEGDVKFQVVSMVGCVGANQEVAPSYMRLTYNKPWVYYPFHMSMLLVQLTSYSRTHALENKSHAIWFGETISRVEEPYTHARVVGNGIFSLIHWMVCAGGS